MQMSYGGRLFYHRKIYDLQGTDALFVNAVKENILYHQTRCMPYAKILERRGFRIDDIKTVDDLYKITPIPTLFLKNHPMYSTSPRNLMFKSTTSGTSGKKSEMGLDWPSAWCGLGMIFGTFFTHKLLSPRPTNYIVLGYQPAKRNKIGAAKTAYAVTFTAPAIHREYALKDNGSEYELNLDGLKNALVRYEKQGLPVRFMGFPAYFMFLLRELADSGIRLKLNPKSLVILAGGWKQYFTERVDKAALYAMAKEALGISEQRIREFFGAVEHPIAYFDCPEHRFHIPVYSRVIIRDENMNPLPYGEPRAAQSNHADDEEHAVYKCDDG